MIVSFGNKLAKEIWEKNSSKSLPKEFWIRAKALMTIMHNTNTIEDLKPKSFRKLIKPIFMTFL